MNPQDLQTLNGKIDKLAEKLDEHLNEHDKLSEKLDPLLDAVRWINTSRKFIVWIGVPIATIGTMIASVKGWTK